MFFFFFFFNDTATTEIYTLSLHDALPIFERLRLQEFEIDSVRAEVLLRVQLLPSDRIDVDVRADVLAKREDFVLAGQDRKSTRLNSSHLVISYAVFCLKKKNNITSAVQHE